MRENQEKVIKYFIHTIFLLLINKFFYIVVKNLEGIT